MNDKSIFKYLKPESNDYLSKMIGSELQDFIYYLSNFYLELRDSINLDDNSSFGLELEMENTDKLSIEDFLETSSLEDKWDLHNDDSLSKRGCEISSPVLFDNKDTWLLLKKICTELRNLAIVNDNTAGHIHIGAHILGDNPTSWLKFIKLWAAYENVIYRFSYGEFLNHRTGIKWFADILAPKFVSIYKNLSKRRRLTLFHVLESLPKNKDTGIAFDNVKDCTDYDIDNTIEFRLPNGTLDEVIWQNNVNFFIKMLYCSKSSRLDEAMIDERFKTIKKEDSNLKYYNQIFLSQALELADIVFTNNLDKIYFLKQYLKSLKVGDDSLEKAKQFTLH